jgi:hypothetical protein
MALSILDGNQSATTLSTILSSGQHITAHTVISLGTQAITDIVNATSAGLTNTQLRASAVTVGGTVTVGNSLTISSLPAISGTVTANVGNIASIIGNNYQSLYNLLDDFALSVTINGASSIGGTQPISGTVTVGNTVTIAGTVTANPTGTQTIAGSVTIGAGTAHIGSVTASISGTVPISISSVTVGNSVTIASLPALVAGTAQIGSVTASISNSVVTFYPLQGTAVSSTNFTSTTASTTLASAVAGREVLTVFSEGPGNLFVSSGATCTTIAYQVRLSAGDYWECPQGQLSLVHTAVFATAGTARVTEVS